MGKHFDIDWVTSLIVAAKMFVAGIIGAVPAALLGLIITPIFPMFGQVVTIIVAFVIGGIAAVKLWKWD